MIGVDVTGTNALGNGTYGISTGGASGVLIGGDTAGQGNVIAANGANGASNSGGIMFFNSARGHRIQGNLIGVGLDGTPTGNIGPGIRCCGSFAESRDNVIGGTAPGEGNPIAYNTHEGVRVTGASPGGTHTSILSNTIHSNGRLGIDLGGFGPTINDPMDIDDGSNDLQNFPIIRRVTNSGSQTLADVEFNSTPETAFRVEFFRNTSCNQPTPLAPASWYGEGQTVVGSQELTTDAAGNWSGTVTLSGETAVTEVITSTATRFAVPGASLIGSTSEFSECLADLSIAKVDEPDPVAVGAPLTYRIEIVNDGPAPATDVRVTDMLPSGVTVTSITPSQGSCSQLSSTVTCLLGVIARDGSARITIVVDPGSAVRTITNTAQVSSELRDPDASDNSASATTQVVALQPATIVVRKVTVPSPDPTDTGFGLTAGGGLSPVSFTLKNGESRTFANLAPRAGYSLAETTPEGWDLLSATCSDGSPLSNIDLSPNETVTCTFTNRRRGTIILHKVTDPAPDSGDTSFGFTAGGGLSPASFSLKNGESRTFANLVPQAGYSLAETTPPSGWDLISATCSDGSPIANVDVAPGETVTCTFTNTKRGSVTLRKTTDGVVDPSKDILFVLSGPGLPSAGVTRSTFGDQDGVLDFGSGNLIPAQTYTICETPVPAGFTSFWKLDGAIVTPYNPSASQIPAEDLGIRCSDFSLTPGQARAFEVDNSHPGGDPRTIGYWKNWNRCTGGDQAATAQKNGGGAAGFFLVEDLLPQAIGDVSITTCQQAIKLTSKQDQNGRSKSSDAAYEPGEQLLAARLNLAAGAETCAAAQQAVLGGQMLLDQINFGGSGDYLGSKSKDPPASPGALARNNARPLQQREPLLMAPPSG